MRLAMVNYHYIFSITVNLNTGYRSVKIILTSVTEVRTRRGESNCMKEP